MKHISTPSLSIIVPTLNEENYIELLLKSISQQEKSSICFEILVVDGGSQDETLNVAKEYNAKILVFPGLGEFASRNIGAEKAKGKYLLFTCSDIIFPKDLFKKVLD